MIEDSWQNCYDNGWNSDLLVPEAFSHPAKMARGLVFRIIAHLLEEGLIQPGQTIVDPFGGVATTALPTLLSGLNYLGVELEPRFVELGRKNIEMWTSKFSGMPKWRGTAELIQGDSRKLAELVRGAAVVSSPPYTGDAMGNDAGCVRLDAIEDEHRRNNGMSRRPAYGTTPGQLGALKAGNHADAVVTSPPFAGNSGGRGEASRNGIDAALFDRHSGGMVGGMGDDPANLGNLRGVVTSPPFENSLQSQDVEFENRRQAARGRNINGFGHVGSLSTYGNDPANVGAESGQTFWQAARAIVEQCALILPSGAPAVFVTKQFVKNGQIVDFTGQWIQLCEACGFKLLHHHRAALTKNGGVGQVGIDGDVTSRAVKRASFFRRLHENRRPDLAIDYEDVTCFIRL